MMVVVVVGRLVRRCREVVRSIALVVHHIQATHSDGAERLRKVEKVVGGDARTQHSRGRLSLGLQTGCILRAIGASIYAQTHTIAMSSSLHTDNAPPAVRSTSTTRGHKMDQIGMKRTHCIRKKK